MLDEGDKFPSVPLAAETITRLRNLYKLGFIYSKAVMLNRPLIEIEKNTSDNKWNLSRGEPNSKNRDLSSRSSKILTSQRKTFTYKRPPEPARQSWNNGQGMPYLDGCQ